MSSGSINHLTAFRILLDSTVNSTISTMKFEGKKPENGAGDGYAAWEALNEKLNYHAKETKKACHEKLVNTKLELGQDPDDFLLILY